MNTSLRLFLIILLFLGFYLIIKTIKKKKLSMKFGMYWTIVFAIMLILIMFPNIIESLAAFCGFQQAPNMLFLIAIFILFYIVFAIYTSISKLSEMNKTLVQEISLLKKEKNKK